MATEHENWIEPGEIYALGALDGEELKALQAHLASGCAVCEAHIRETRETLNQLPRSLHVITPPAAVKTRVFERLTPRQSEAAVQQSRHWPEWRWWFVGAGSLAAAAIVFATAAILVSSRNELAQLRSQLAAVQTGVQEKDQLIEFLTAPEVRSVQLTGLAAAPRGKGKLFWNPGTGRGLLITSGLPKPSADKTYELWGIEGTQPVAAGVFSVDDAGEARVPLPQVAPGREFDKFAVTLEPAGGVSKPSGPMVLLGSL
jgi:anti-sigma-K factor RskA